MTMIAGRTSIAIYRIPDQPMSDASQAAKAHSFSERQLAVTGTWATHFQIRDT